MTQVFISWSGTIGNKVAHALFEWLPSVIQEIEPYFSTQIDKGAVWQTDIYDNLQTSKFGIVCVTQDSKTSPWLHYEAGALMQRLPGRENPRVATFLHHIRPDEIKAPLAALQATKSSEKDEVKRFVESINKQCSSPLAPRRLDEAFELTYGSLEKALLGIESTDSKEDSTELQGVEPTPAEADVRDLVIELSTKFQALSDQLNLRPVFRSSLDGPTFRRHNINGGVSPIEMRASEQMIQGLLEQVGVEYVISSNHGRRGLDLYVESPDQPTDRNKLIGAIRKIDSQIPIRVFSKDPTGETWTLQSDAP